MNNETDILYKMSTLRIYHHNEENRSIYYNHISI